MELHYFTGTVGHGLRDSKFSNAQPYMVINHEGKGDVMVDVICPPSEIASQNIRLLDRGDKVVVYGRPVERMSGGKPVFKAIEIKLALEDDSADGDDSPPAQVASDEPCCSIPAQYRLNGSPTGWHSGPCMEANE